MFLTTAVQKVEFIAELFKKDAIEAATASGAITAKLLSALTSPEALVIESLIPGGAAYAVDAIAAIKLVTPTLTMLANFGDNESTLATLQRLGSKLTSIIHGGKHDFAFYVTLFQVICFGNPVNTLPVAKAA